MTAEIESNAKDCDVELEKSWDFFLMYLEDTWAENSGVQTWKGAIYSYDFVTEALATSSVTQTKQEKVSNYTL